MVVDPELLLKIVTDYEDKVSPGLQQTQRQMEQAARQMAAAPDESAVHQADAVNGMILRLQRERMSKQQKLNLDYQQAVAQLHQSEQFSAANKARILEEMQRTHLFRIQALDKQAAAEAAATATAAASAVTAGVAVALAALGALAYGAYSIIEDAVKRAVKLGDEINRVALQTNIAVSDVSAMKYAAEQNESSLGDMTRSLRYLSVAMNEASQGSKEQQRIFRQLGVEYRETATGGLRAPVDVLSDLMHKMSTSQDQAQLTAKAVKLLGRSADELLPLIRQVQAYEKALADAQAMGFVLSPAEARLADEFGDHLKTISSILDTISRAVAVELLPVFNDLAAAVEAWWRANHEAVTGDIQAVFAELAALLREIGAAAEASGPSIMDMFNMAASAGLALIAVVDNAASGFYRLRAGLASAKSLAQEVLGEHIKAGEFAREAEQATQMADRLAKSADRAMRGSAAFMAGTAAEMEQVRQSVGRISDDLRTAQAVIESLQAGFYRKRKTEADQEAEKANEQLDKTILAAAQARMSEEERLLSEYLRAVEEVQKLEFGSRQKKEEAVYQLTLTYNQKRMELLRKEADAVAQQWREVQARIMGQEQAALDARNQQLFEGIQAYNAAMSDMAIAAAGPFEKLRLEYERDVESFRQKLGEKSALFQQWLQARNTQLQRDQQAYALGQQQNRLQLEAEITISRIEMDKSLPEQLRQAYAEVQRAQAEVQSAQLGLEMATLANDTDAAAAAVLKLAAAYQKLDAAQKDAKKAEKDTKAMTGAMKSFGQAIEQSFLAAAYAAAMSGENMAKAIAEQMKAVAVQEAILGIVELAKFWGCVLWDPPAAAAHLTSSNLHFLAAAMCGAASAIAGAASGGGGGGGSSEQTSGPREYTQADLDRLRGGGQNTGTSGGGSASETESGKQPIIFNTNTIFKNANDSRDVRRYEKKMAKIRAEATLKYFARNAYQARQMARLQAGEY